MRKIDIWPLLSQEMQAVVRKSEELAKDFVLDTSGGHPLPRMRQAYNESTRYWNADPLPIGRIEDFAWDCGHGLVPLRLYHPEPGEPRPVLIYLHGGGFVLGNLDTHDCIMRHLCRYSGWAVLGLDYSLAPEARFPRQIEEAAGLIQALPTLAEGRFLDLGLVAFAGDSAGANLCLATCVELRGRGLPLPALQLLFYGGYGLTDSYSQRLYGGPLDGLSENERAFYRNAYCHPSRRDDQRYDLLNADLSGMPPAYLLTLTLDPLDDDTRALAAQLELSGVAHAVRRWEGVIHGCLKNLRELASARAILAEAGAGLRALQDGAVAGWLDRVARTPLAADA